jgi:hypothetical protein
MARTRIAERVRLAGLMALAVIVGVLVLACSARSELFADETGSGAAAGAGGQGGTTTQPQGGNGGSAPSETRFVLSFISDIPESIWVNETDPAWTTGHWLTIERGGAAIRKAHACEYCSCGDCPNCPICGQPCPTAIEVESGQQAEYVWSGFEFPAADCPSAPQQTCLEQVAAPPGSYTAVFCWGWSYEGTPPCPADVVGLQCVDVPFVHPDPDGVVDYLVNNGG